MHGACPATTKYGGGCGARMHRGWATGSVGVACCCASPRRRARCSRPSFRRRRSARASAGPPSRRKDEEIRRIGDPGSPCRASRREPIQRASSLSPIRLEESSMRVLRSLVASRRRLFASIAALGAVTIAAVGGTYANFTATPLTIPNNAITTGTLELQRSGSGAVLTAQALKVGDTANGSVTITNTGTLTGTFTLSGALEGGSDAILAGQLRLVVYEDSDGSGTPVYDGAFSAFGSAGLGTFGP